MGIAFVAFTTQFGGGFASSAQIYQYFINYGLRMRSAVWPAARCRPSPRRTARSVRRSGWRCCISSSSSRRSRSCISTCSRSRTSSRSTAQPSACLSATSQRWSFPSSACWRLPMRQILQRFRSDARSDPERRGRRRAHPDHLHFDHPRFDFDCGQYDLRHRHTLRQRC